MLPSAKQVPDESRPRLRLHCPALATGHYRYWRINGHLATIHCWSEAEFETLANPPADAIHYPEGVWIELRWEDEHRLN